MSYHIISCHMTCSNMPVITSRRLNMTELSRRTSRRQRRAICIITSFHMLFNSFWCCSSLSSSLAIDMLFLCLVEIVHSFFLHGISSEPRQRPATCCKNCSHHMIHVCLSVYVRCQCLYVHLLLCL